MKRLLNTCSVCSVTGRYFFSLWNLHRIFSYRTCDLILQKGKGEPSHRICNKTTWLITLTERLSASFTTVCISARNWNHCKKSSATLFLRATWWWLEELKPQETSTGSWLQKICRPNCVTGRDLISDRRNKPLRNIMEDKTGAWKNKYTDTHCSGWQRL